MSWAKKRKKSNIAEIERKTYDISEMSLIKCASCGCHLRYSVKKPKEKQYCSDCEKVRSKHNIPWC